MLQMVSWKEYFTLIGLGLVVYYGYVTVRYFPRELQQVGQLKRRRAGEEEYESDEVELESKESTAKFEDGNKVDKLVIPATNGVTQKESQKKIGDETGREKKEEVDPEEIGFGEENQTCLVIAQALSKEIKVLVQEAGERKMVRGELMIVLQMLLAKDRYQSLRTNPVFVDSINNLILFDVEHNCSIHFDAEELKGLWVR